MLSKIQTACCFVVLLLITSGTNAQSGENFYSNLVEKKWATNQALATPESVCYDANHDVLYVSNIKGSSTEKDGKGYISRLTMEGDILDIKWIEGLNAPKGMGIHEGKLYVTDIDELVVIGIKKGEILEKYPYPEAKFLNDIAVDEKGRVYISDMRQDLIYQLMNGQSNVWMDHGQLNQPNGLYYQNERLWIGNKGKILEVNTNTKDAAILVNGITAVDGLKPASNGYWLKSDWAGKTHMIHPKKENKLLINTTPAKIRSADFEYIPEQQVLFIPTFGDNRIIAYEIQMP